MPGPSVRMDKLDLLVAQHMAERLLGPERLTTLLSTLAGRRAERADAIDRRLAALAREAEEADERLRRLYKLVEDGRDKVDDFLKRRIADLKLAREKALAALERARFDTWAVEDISPLVVERFAKTMREKLTTGEVAAVLQPVCCGRPSMCWWAARCASNTKKQEGTGR